MEHREPLSPTAQIILAREAQAHARQWKRRLDALGRLAGAGLPTLGPAQRVAAEVLAAWDARFESICWTGNPEPAAEEAPAEEAPATPDTLLVTRLADGRVVPLRYEPQGTL